MVMAVSNLHMLQSAAFAEMIATDEMFLPQLGVEKRAIFCVIPDNDDTFNFMVSILYTQLFDQLFRLADSTPEFHGTLPVHVRLMMDEFANVATPENFVKILAVARSRNISCRYHSAKYFPDQKQIQGRLGNDHWQLRQLSLPWRQ